MNGRVTLVNTGDRSREWHVTPNAQSRIVFAASFKVLRYALEDAIHEFEQDVERVIVDRTATPAEFLDLLAHVSEQFAGEVLYVQDDARAYLSAIGRGGSRVLYALNAADLRFYLETHGLIEIPSVAAA